MIKLKTTADQSEVQGAVAALENLCASLAHKVREAGMGVPTAPIRADDDIVARFNALDSYAEQLAAMLAGRTGVQASANLTAANATIATLQAQLTSARAHAASAPAAAASILGELSADELRACTLTEKCQLFAKSLTTQDLRERLAARSATSKIGRVSLVGRVLAAEGCATLSDLRSKKANDPHPKTD
jgi:hypothetical protein